MYRFGGVCTSVPAPLPKSEEVVLVRVSNLTALLFASLLIGMLSAPFHAAGQLEEMMDLSGLRTMANMPGTPQAGMEVGNVNVPSLTQQPQTEEKKLPEEEQTPAVQQIFFDTNKIDPDRYIVGVDDLLSLYLWDKLDKEYTLVVNPEGTVVIPTVGVAEVAGVSLTVAKERIRKEVFKKYKDIGLSVTLARPRFFRVFVSGIVNRPGAVESHSLQRVSDVIDRARLFFEDIQVQSENRLRRISSRRNIVVHRGETNINVDLLLFQKFGDLSANPYVSAGDIIEVPPALGNTYIFGTVNDQGRYEFKPGDRIFDLVKFGGGLTSTADTSLATLARFEEKGKKVQYIDVNLYDALFTNPDDPSFRLQEFDRLFVRKKFDFKTISNVSLNGEVKYPGSYAITPNETKLSDVIRMAGGFTDRVNLEEAEFYRIAGMSRDMEYLRLSKMLKTDMTDEEYDYFRNVSRTRAGELSIDFVKLFRDNDLNYDTVLQDGDRITIPAKRQFIHVMGAVQQPGYMKIEPGADYTFYVEKAGGYNWNAKSSKIRIIKAQTGQRFKASKKVPIEAGDTINIPEKKPADLWSFTKDMAFLFANVTTVIILAKQLTK
jgi:protein involved in polysaccharide export with SLBB domain